VNLMIAIVRRAVLADCADIALLVRNYWTLESIEGFDRNRITELLAAFLSHPEQNPRHAARWSGARPAAARCIEQRACRSGFPGCLAQR
jgi:hypothetical protein